MLDPPAGRWATPADRNVYRIAHTSFDGDTLMVLESRRPPLPVTAAQRDSAIAAVREATGQDHDWSRIPKE